MKYDIYVDGGYKEGKSSWGALILDEDGSCLYKNAGLVKNSSMLEMNNVAGELAATLVACEWVSRHTTKDDVININHDYMGIAKWALGEWRAKKPWTKKYQNLMLQIRSERRVKFTHIKSHSGNYYNDVVDEMCTEQLRS